MDFQTCRSRERNVDAVPSVRRLLASVEREGLGSVEEVHQATCPGFNHSCGQSYKHFTIVNYNSRVVIWANLSQYNSRVVNYNCKVLYRIDHCSVISTTESKYQTRYRYWRRNSMLGLDFEFANCSCTFDVQSISQYFIPSWLL